MTTPAIPYTPARRATQGADNRAFMVHMSIIAAIALVMAILSASIASPIVATVAALVSASAAFAGIYLSLNRIA
ncbi:hypothetical protein [uncultured Tessaracoccus sp.]|uniref:hypothetical protein n=1 Tax=uncultured Tessaracoccus sp. TaxID=905023 RepID=UPI0026358E9F|nr:hypothetical protein [uncultured Tessaracoccus sp.]